METVSTASIRIISAEELELTLNNVTTTIAAGDDPVATTTDVLQVLSEAGYKID